MDIYRAERLAQDMAVHGGNDWDKSFIIVGPVEADRSTLSRPQSK